MKRKSILFIGALTFFMAIAGCSKSSGKSSASEPKSETPSSTVEPVSSDSSVPTPSSSSAPSSSTQPSSSSQSSRPSSSSSTPQSSTSAPQPSSSSSAPSSPSSNPSSSSSTPVVEETKYYALYNEQEIALAKVNDAVLAENQVAEYKAVLGNIEKGKSISVLDNNKQALAEKFNAETGDNNVSGEVGSYVIHNDASDAFILVKEWADWTNFYVSGYVADPVVEPVYKVVGTMNQWRYQDSAITFVDATNAAEVEAGNYVKQLKASFKVEKDDEFEVTDGQDNWITGRQLEANENFEVIDKGSGTGNIKALYKGDVDLYLKIFADETKGLAIIFEKDEVPTPAPVYKVVGTFNSWNYNDNAVAFADNSDPAKVAAGEYAQLLTASFDVIPNLEFKVTDGSSVWLGGEVLAATPEDFSVEANGNIKALARGTVDLSLTIKSDGAKLLSIVFNKVIVTPQEVKVTLQVTKDVGDGNSIYLVGGFCDWKASDEKAVKFTWGEGNVWTAEWTVMTETTYECKLVVAASENPSEMTWEGGNNRNLLFTEAGSLTLNWQQ